jgi:hypothetical protein
MVYGGCALYFNLTGTLLNERTNRANNLIRAATRYFDQVDESSVSSVEQPPDADESVVALVQMRADAGPARQRHQIKASILLSEKHNA